MRDAGLRDQHPAEMQVGILVLVSLLILAGGVLWVSGVGFGGGVPLYVEAPSAASATEGDAVMLRGMRVGAIDRIELVPGGVVLSLNVQEAESLAADSRVVIRGGAFLGAATVELVPGSAQATLQAGDTLQAEVPRGLQDMAGALGEDAQDVMQRTAALLSDTTVRSVQRASGNAAATMEELRALVESERESIANLVVNLERVSSRLRQGAEGPEVERTVAALDSMTAEMKVASRNLNTSSEHLSSVLAKVDRGDGSLGKLINDDRLYEEATAALSNLQQASEEVAALTADIRRNPKRYLSVSIF